jgi:hypothetical protein
MGRRVPSRPAYSRAQEYGLNVVSNLLMKLSFGRTIDKVPHTQGKGAS